MPSKRARAARPLFQVAVLGGGQWRLHPSKFASPAIARTFGAQLEPRGYAVELSKTGWPIAVLFCDPDLAAEIVTDLIRR